MSKKLVLVLLMLSTSLLASAQRRYPMDDHDLLLQNTAKIDSLIDGLGELSRGGSAEARALALRVNTLENRVDNQQMEILSNRTMVNAIFAVVVAGVFGLFFKLVFKR